MFVSVVCSYFNWQNLALSASSHPSSKGASSPTNLDDGPGSKTKAFPSHRINARLTSKSAATTILMASTYHAPWYTTSYIDDMVPAISILQDLSDWNREGVGEEDLDGDHSYSPNNDGYDDAGGELGEIEMAGFEEDPVHVLDKHEPASDVEAARVLDGSTVVEDNDIPITCRRLSRLGILFFDERYGENEFTLNAIHVVHDDKGGLSNSSSSTSETLGLSENASDGFSSVSIPSY